MTASPRAVGTGLDPTAGAITGSITGRTDRLTAEPTAGPIAGPGPEPTAGSTAGPTAGPGPEPTAGSIADPTAGPGTADPTAGPTTGRTAVDVAEASRMSRQQRVVLAVLLTGIFMAAVDQAIVNVAAPAIAVDLHLGDAALQLAIASYTIAYAGLLIIGARLGQRYGYRRLFVAGLVTFTVASLVCGLAQHEPTLIVGRVVQGLGAAAFAPQIVTLIQLTFSGGRR